MQVSLQFAEEHFADLVSAVNRGEEVEIAQPEKPILKLVASLPVPAPAEPAARRILGELRAPGFEKWQATENPEWRSPERPRSELLGSLRGKIEFAMDWDSPETNKEIEELAAE